MDEKPVTQIRKTTKAGIDGCREDDDSTLEDITLDEDLPAGEGGVA